jgi:hypothetical protein
MTDRVALSLVLLIGLLIAADLLMGFGATLFLARKFVDLLDLLAVWR